MSLLCLSMAACQRAVDAPAAPNKVLPIAPRTADAEHFAGAGSCSGRSCHGGLEARLDQEIGQHEYTAWLTHDPHANAYQVLHNEVSERIANNLGGKKKAFEDQRCLSCHVTPYAADRSLSHAKAEMMFGVGCESCHGAAGEWLGPHTEAKWKDYNSAQKKDKGMVPVRSLPDLAQACVGCHVGAPADKQTPLLRDVNHDLIAAGHPRLNFELDVFLDNLPPHWNKQKKAERDGKEIHSKAWAHGQLASAEAALKLLDWRADEKNGRPWPEFAEYDCYACHHDLQDKSWRQGRDPKGGRRLGALPWGTWYFTMPRLLGDGLPAPNKSLRASLDALEDSMSRAAPNRTKVVEQARMALDDVKKLHGASASWDGDAKAVQRWLTAIGRDERLANDPNWDAAMQLYLALYSLESSSVAIPSFFERPNQFSRDDLQKWLKRLAK